MKKLFLILNLLLSIMGYSAGPPPICSSTGNDNCINAIEIFVNNPCSDGCTEGAGTQIGETFGCDLFNKTIWYKFNATATSHQVNIWQDASNGCYNGSVVWQGGCIPTIPISCHDDAFGPLNQAHLLTGLIIGNTYLIQVGYSSGGPCGANADVCVEVITYDPCDLSGGCGDICYAACEFVAPPPTSDVTCCCPSMAYNPPMHERNRTECYSFTGNSASVTFSAILSSDCGGGQFTKLEWTLYDATCSVLEGPTNIFVDNTASTIAGNDYIFCYDMTFAECNISEMWTYVVVGATLPIELLYFNAEIMGDNYVYLSWSTASEINNDYFTIEKSIDGTNFVFVNNVFGSGNSRNIIKYSTIDDKPYYGIISYYRLKQTDYDGKYKYSDLAPIKLLFDNNNENMIIFDINGKIVNNNWDNLPMGIYFIKLNDFNGQKIFKE